MNNAATKTKATVTKTYDVANGVDFVNGAPVPKNRKVQLTEVQALYDLSLGRISLPSQKSSQLTIADTDV